jgi:hypothetical protein
MTNNKHACRGGPRKFTVKTRQQSGCKLTVNKITFTRFTTLSHFLDLYADLYVIVGALKKVWIAGRGRVLG